MSIVKCNERWIYKIIDYIGINKENNLYLAIAFQHYGISNHNMIFFAGEDDKNGKITFLVMIENSNMYIMCHDVNALCKRDFSIFIDYMKVNSIEGSANIIDSIGEMINGTIFKGYLLKYNGGGVNWEYTNEIQRARIEDVDAICDLLACNKCEIGNRIDSNFGRNYIVKVGKEVVGNISVIAEDDKSAIVNDIIIHPDYRGGTMFMDLRNKAFQDLLIGGKYIYDVIYDKKLIKLSKATGFSIIQEYAKIIK